MASALRTYARHARRLVCALLAGSAFLTAPAFAATSPPASALTPEVLFGLAILGPMLVPAAAYTAGLIADLLQRSKDD